MVVGRSKNAIKIQTKRIHDIFFKRMCLCICMCVQIVEVIDPTTREHIHNHVNTRT